MSRGCFTPNLCFGRGSTIWAQNQHGMGFSEEFLWVNELVASSPTSEPTALQLTLTGSAPQSCHHHSPSATSPLGPGGAGRTSWSLGCLGTPTTAGTGSAGPSGAPPAARKANIISIKPWNLLLPLLEVSWRASCVCHVLTVEQKGKKTFPNAMRWVVEPSP